MATLKILVESVDSDADLQALIDSQKPAAGKNMPDFAPEYLKSLRSGLKSGSVIRYSACETQASSTASLSSVVANDTVTIGAKVLTAKASPASQDQFLVGADDTETAANLASCINANTDLKNWLKASPSAATVVVTCLVSGVMGNNIALSSSATVTWSSAFFALGADANNSQETT